MYFHFFQRKAASDQGLHCLHRTLKGVSGLMES